LPAIFNSQLKKVIIMSMEPVETLTSIQTMEETIGALFKKELVNTKGVHFQAKGDLD
jgi:hypothetical protein